ncbi:hypothetical protein MANAM107_20020 [Actinomyces capricornis]|uniref:Uncharacterized protein n=1 Tax=Actinomyces capricornis TaxID=2755559 RepID=A0ABN6K6J6_9ACTO|nr:hypothetical protein MANAM107_20020 [Actinomyces capricornis]
MRLATAWLPGEGVEEPEAPEEPPRAPQALRARAVLRHMAAAIRRRAPGRRWRDEAGEGVDGFDGVMVTRTSGRDRVETGVIKDSMARRGWRPSARIRAARGCVSTHALRIWRGGEPRVDYLPLLPEVVLRIAYQWGMV